MQDPAEKFDITKIYPQLYKAEQKKVQLVQVPPLRVLAIAGEGDPDGKMFQQSVEALYAITYYIKFLPKKGPVPEDFIDFKVSPLEGLWNMRDDVEFDAKKRENWQWEALLVVPGFVTQALVDMATENVAAKKPNPQYEQLRIKTLEEKQAVQILHVGSYKNEEANLALLHSYMASHELKRSGKHHEVYLNDPRRTATNKLKTILRQPIIKQ